MDYQYDDVKPRMFNDPFDVQKLGGKVICGSISSHMWTNPDIYYWGSAVDIISIGRGNVIMCQLNLLNAVKKSPIAENLLVNLVNYAYTLIKPGQERRLLNRCIDKPVA